MGQKRLKLAILGDSGVGKTSLAHILTNQPLTDPKVTIGADVLHRTYAIASHVQPLKIEVWDTSGQEKYRSLTQHFYRDAEGVWLVVDATQPFKAERIQDWIDEICRMMRYRDLDELHQHMPLCLLANKADSPEHRLSTLVELRAWCQLHHTPFFNVSAKWNNCLEPLLENTVQTVLHMRSQIGKQLDKGPLVKISERKSNTSCIC